MGFHGMETHGNPHINSYHGFPSILGEDVTKHVTGHNRSEGMNDSVCMTYVRISVGYQQ